MFGAEIPHRCRETAPPESETRASRNMGLYQVFFRELMIELSGGTVHNRMAFASDRRFPDLVLWAFCMPMNAPAEAAALRIRCVFVQRLLGDDGARHHKEKPPAACPIGNQHSTRSDPPRNRSCRSTVPDTDHSTSRPFFAAKHLVWKSCKRFDFLCSDLLLPREELRLRCVVREKHRRVFPRPRGAQFNDAFVGAAFTCRPRCP